jgi:3-deoxy-D-manno-octulosonic-acid transferase
LNTTFVRHWLKRAVLYPERCSRSIWVHGDSPRQFNAAGLLLRSLHHRLPAHRFVLTSASPAAVRYLRLRYPSDFVLPPPANVAASLTRWIRELHPEALVLLDLPHALPEAVIHRLRARRTPVVFVECQAAVPAALPSWIESVERFAVATPGSAERLAARGVRKERIRVTGCLELDGVGLEEAESAGALRRELGLGADRFVVGVAALQQEEEVPVLEAIAAAHRALPAVAVVCAPANPKRSRAVARRLGALGFSRNGHRDLVLVGRREEQLLAARCADVVVGGGTFVETDPSGRLFETGLAGRPMLLGPSVASRTRVDRVLLDAGAAVATGSNDLAREIAALTDDPGRLAALAERTRQTLRRDAGASCRTLDAILPAMPTRDGAGPDELGARLPSRIGRFAQSGAGRTLMLTRASRRIGTLDALAARLGYPETILCLGNGPSSEQEDLAGLGYDCLFRVNWRWRDRGFLVDPHLTFVGDAQTVWRVPRGIFGFRTIDWESEVLARHLLRGHVRPFPHFTAERDPVLSAELAWQARPSNGVLMVMTAAALQPRRLIVAGVDLYEHAAGRYPGDLWSESSYAQVHHRDVELAILRRAFGRFKGDLEIVGAPLALALR